MSTAGQEYGVELEHILYKDIQSRYMDASSNDEFTTTFGKLFQWLITLRLKN